MNALVKAGMQFPTEFAKNLVETQVEYLKGLGLPPAVLFFWIEGLKAWKQAVQTPAVFFGHQEHFKH